MNRIEEIIIVEGIHDIAHLKQFLDADFIKTDGSSLPEETKQEILSLKEKGKEFIILTDPDYPGEKIRKQLLELIPNAKQAFVRKEKARTSKKVGVEHADKEEILEALENCVTYHEKTNSLSWNEYIELGLSGRKESAKLREKVGFTLHLGFANSKTFYKRLNMLDITKEELEKIING